MAALLFSSLVNAILFFRVIEVAYFEPEIDHHGSRESAGIDEAPLSMLGPLVIVSVSLILIGIYAGDIVTNIIQYAVPAGL
jgi:multicomponent Na+:H+ antiporter subunit D